MPEGTRILWRCAIDAGSRALQTTDLAPALQALVRDLQVEDCNDPGKCVAQLRFTKRIRPPPIIKSLRHLLEIGRIQRAWVERPDGAERVQLANEQWIQMEPVVGRPKKKGAPAGAKKQRKAVSEEEQDGEEDAEEDGEENEEENGDDDDDDGNHAEDTHSEIDVILSTINRIERQVRDLKRKVGLLKKNKNTSLPTSQNSDRRL
jgi:TATA-binding protein-associated factor Taf7